MEINITFLGAARNVTGSKYLVEVNGIRLLVDCGLYQERGLKNLNWEPFHISPDKIDIRTINACSSGPLWPYTKIS